MDFELKEAFNKWWDTWLNIFKYWHPNIIINQIIEAKE